MIKRDKLILIIAGVLSVIGFIGIIVMVLFKSPSTSSKPEAIRTEANKPAESIIKYEKGSEGRLLEKLTGESNLSGADLSARQKVTSSIPEKSGTLLLSQKVRLDYLATPDFFQAEILSTDVSGAKQEAISWLISQGISQSGICNLPIMFFLGPIPAEEFIKTREVFSPLAPGC